VRHLERVEAFLLHLGGQRIDAIPDLTGERADWLLPEHRLIVEVKSLEDDRVARVQAVIDKWSPTFGIVYGQRPLQDIIRNNRYREQINKEIAEAALASVEPAFKKSNRQLRTMRRTLAAPDWYGAVIFVIEDVYFFDPAALEYEIGRLFAKKGRETVHPRYVDVDWVFIPTAAHMCVGADGRASSLLMSWAPPTTPRRAGLEALANFVVAQWARFHGVPLVRLSIDEIAGMEVRPRNVPTLRIPD
jgi:hypothetical protein